MNDMGTPEWLTADRAREGDRSAISVFKTARLYLLGTPAFHALDRRINLPEKAYCLAAILALAPDASESRARLRSILWGDYSDLNGNVNLRQLIRRISKATSARGILLIRSERQSVSLVLESLNIDLLDWVGNKVSTLIRNQNWNQLSLLVRSYGGELLMDARTDDTVLEDWLARERANLKATFVSAAVALLEQARQTADENLEIAAKLIGVDPTQEAGYRARILIYGERGDISRSRKAFLDCERALRTELDIAPSPETIALSSRFFDAEGRLAPAVVMPQGARGGTPSRKYGVDDAAGRPRIAILPPVDPFDDPALRRLSLYLLEDLTVGLARFRSFRTMAVHTGPVLSASAPTSGRQSKVDWCDYILASVISERENSFELRFRLSDARSGEVIWGAAMPFEGNNLPRLYSSLCDHAVAALADAVERSEVQAPLPASDNTAYRLFLEGRRYLGSTDLKELRRARRLFRQANKRDPHFSGAYAGLARTNSMEWIVRGSDETGLLMEALDYADLAIAADSHDGRGYREKGFALLYLKRFDESLSLFSEAANRNPNDADLLADYADALAHAGDPRSALTVLGRAMALSPSPPDFYRWIAGSIYYQMGHYSEAMAALEPVKYNPATARLLAASAAQTGNRELAEHYLMIMRENLPDFKIEQLWRTIPNRHESDTKHLVEGLQLAGLKV